MQTYFSMCSDLPKFFALFIIAIEFHAIMAFTHSLIGPKWPPLNPNPVVLAFIAYLPVPSGFFSNLFIFILRLAIELLPYLEY